MPDEYWLNKCDEMVKLKEERAVIRSRLREGKGVRHELLKVAAGELTTAFETAVLDYASENFLMYLEDRGIVSEYWWQALEEYAEGSAGGLSLYWPPAAHRDCSEGAMVRADWIVQWFANERDEFDVPPPYTPPRQQSKPSTSTSESPHARHSSDFCYGHLVDLIDLGDDRAPIQHLQPNS
ncbi:hypothetical protein JCM10295v2_004476 [Rhodotorula toruloides]